MNKKKIFNDPVYGFITIPYNIVFDLIEHPYFQRLRRIKQLGLTHYVYPGALHTRFHHALGAMHLMTEAIDVLRSKGVIITEQESIAVCIAILLHDIGHGPFSHALERKLVDEHHETLSLFFMEELDEIFGGQLALAIQIFQKKHHKVFLSQLVSGQLDMDRMDYLNRDSFFTGVSEGVIGYDRIIKMLAVRNNELVIEEKGFYSVEKFLIARRIMYWQVYLHKTVLSAEQMLIRVFERAKILAKNGSDLIIGGYLAAFLKNQVDAKDRKALLHAYASLDDVDIVAALKKWQEHPDETLSFLSKSLLNRHLFKVIMSNQPFSEEEIKAKSTEFKNSFTDEAIPFMVFTGKETNRAYNARHDEIKILLKNGKIDPMSSISEHSITSKIISKYYLCYPKNKN